MAEHVGQKRSNAAPAVGADRRAGASGPHAELLNRRTEARLAGPAEHLARRSEAVAAAAPHPVQPLPAPNRTGLPDRLKAGIEALSGIAMDDVRVHCNSPRPAALGALAFAQGGNIHLGPGQEQHLPHEAWHVVQQKQGRVRATRHVGGTAINEDRVLERESDAMGTRAATHAHSTPIPPAPRSGPVPVLRPLVQRQAGDGSESVAQCVMPESPPEFEQFINSRTADLNWPATARLLQERISLLMTGLDKAKTKEEQADLKFLRSHEASAKAIVLDGNKFFKLGSTKDGLTGASDKKNRSDKKSRDRLVQIELQLKSYYMELTDIAHSIDDRFFDAGRISAVGRSAPDSMDKKARQESSVYFEDVIIDDKRHGLQSKPVESTASSNLLQINGKQYSKASPHKKAAEEAQKIGGAVLTEQTLSSPTIRGKTRGLGQAASMSNTNARGYAWAAGMQGWDTRDWEWLHIRGASLGGETSSKNLVLGTYDANTHMMPFEDNVIKIGSILKSYGSAQFTVNWSASESNKKFSHMFGAIKVAWQASLFAIQMSGEATFRPLQDRQPITKSETKALEALLTTHRTALDHYKKSHGGKGQKRGPAEDNEEQEEEEETENAMTDSSLAPLDAGKEPKAKKPRAKR